MLTTEYLNSLTVSELWRLIYLSDEYRKFKHIVRKQYSYRCRACGKEAGRNVRMHVHHIKPKAKFPQYTLTVQNAELLCRKCHIVEHTKIRDEHPEYKGIPSADSVFLIQLIQRLTYTFYFKKLARYKARKRHRSRRPRK